MKTPRFLGRRGEDVTLWRNRLRAACRVKTVWNIVNNGSASSQTSENIGDVHSDNVRTSAKREKACGIIISALGDTPLRVVMEVDDDPTKMLRLLDNHYASSRTVSTIVE